MNQLTNVEAVYRSAPATPGLLKNVHNKPRRRKKSINNPTNFKNGKKNPKSQKIS